VEVKVEVVVVKVEVVEVVMFSSWGE